MFKVLLSFIFYLSIWHASFAAEHFLYDKYGKQIKGYEKILAGVGAGDILHFDNGRTFLIREKLGGGGTTQVFRVIWNSSDGTRHEAAIRIPKATGIAGKSGNVYNTFLNAFGDTHPILEELKVPIPKIYESEKSRYIIVEKFEVKKGETLESFLKNLSNDSYSLSELKIRKSAFKDFIKRTSHISYVSDFKLEQVLFDTKTKEWKLADWTFQAVNSSLIDNEHLISYRQINPLLGKIPAENRNIVIQLMAEADDINKNFIKKEKQIFLSKRQSLLELIKNGKKEDIKTIVRTLLERPYSEIIDEKILKFYKTNIDYILASGLMNEANKLKFLQSPYLLDELEFYRDKFLGRVKKSIDYVRIIESNLWAFSPESYRKFLELSPNAEEALRVAVIFKDKTIQLSLLSDYVKGATRVEDILKVVNYIEFGENIMDNYHRVELIKSSMVELARLEPTASEMEYIKNLLKGNGLGDLYAELLVKLDLKIKRSDLKCNKQLLLNFLREV